MANTLTNLTPDIYRGLDVVSRELVGMIPAVSMNASLATASKDQTIRSHVTPAASTVSTTFGQQIPNSGDQTISNITHTIDTLKHVQIRWNGQEQNKMNSGPGYGNIKADQVAQAIRAHTNDIEAKLSALHASASRAVGPAGTDLFDAANYKDVANVNRILNENGAPLQDRQLVLSSRTAALFKGNATYTQANTAGTDSILRQGVLLDQFGTAIRESAQMVSFTAGTGSSATLDGSAYSEGDLVLTLASAGTGTILAGDIITIATSTDENGDLYEYVVASGDSDVSNGGTITLAAPGLKTALAASAHAITVKTGRTERNMAFTRNAIELIVRQPEFPAEGDAATESMSVQDPRSGLNFMVRRYPEFGQTSDLVLACYGAGVNKAEHLCLLAT